MFRFRHQWLTLPGQLIHIDVKSEKIHAPKYKDMVDDITIISLMKSNLFEGEVWELCCWSVKHTPEFRFSELYLTIWA
jgi:hypothetical protein